MVDANVLFAAVVWPRWPYEVLQHALRGDFQLLLSPLVIAQARRVLERRFEAWMPALDSLLNQLAYELTPDPSPAQVRRHAGLVRDDTDIPIALAAIQARVDYLVSEDKDLTVQDDSTAMLRARVRVMLSGTFLREVMGWETAALEQARRRTWRDLSPSAG